MKSLFRFWSNRSSPERPAPSPHLELGRRGERLALRYLEREGYRLVATNYTLPVGRDRRRGRIISAEIDIIAYEGPTLCFVEVKTRVSDRFAAPEANVTRRKQRQISRAARAYRRMHGLEGDPYRFDVVSVLCPAEIGEAVPPPARLQLHRAFWTDESFRKRWREEPFAEP